MVVKQIFPSVYLDAVDKVLYEIPSYEIKKLEKFLSLIKVYSIDDLEKEYTHKQDISRVTTTFYKHPSKCIRIWRKDYLSNELVPPADNRNTVDTNLSAVNSKSVNDNNMPSWIRLKELIINREGSSKTSFLLNQNKDGQDPLIIYYLQILGYQSKIFCVVKDLCLKILILMQKRCIMSLTCY